MPQSPHVTSVALKDGVVWIQALDAVEDRCGVVGTDHEPLGSIS